MGENHGFGGAVQGAENWSKSRIFADFTSKRPKNGKNAQNGRFLCFSRFVKTVVFVAEKHVQNRLIMGVVVKILQHYHLARIA